jgi:hypothetical protein
MQFHRLAFEGPDDYARAGGLATRITGLALALAEAGHETHLWFVGDLSTRSFFPSAPPGFSALSRVVDAPHKFLYLIDRFFAQG